MTVEFAMEVFREMIGLSLLLVSPLLVTAVVVGMVVSILQAVTSIQEQTLSFVPKLVAMCVVAMVLGFWILAHLIAFTVGLFNRLPDMVG